MRRVICIYLPHWPIEARRKRTSQRSGAPDKPFAIVGQDGQKQIICAVNRSAAHDGLTPGMPLTHARAIVPHLAIAPDQPLEDAKALHRLAMGCVRFSPLVALAPPDALWLDVTGVAHLFGGEQPMLARIARLLARSGLTPRIAIANTPGAAWALSHYAQERIVMSSQVDDLNTLPLMALRITEFIARGFWRVGIKSIGELRHLPRATVPLRFGKEVIARLDQALGRAPEALNPLLPPQARRREQVFAEPICTREALDWIAARLTRELCDDLETAQEGARKLDLVFRRTDHSIQAVRIGMRRATRDPTHIFKLLTEHFDTIDPGFGIDAAALTAWRVEPLTPTQIEADGSVVQDNKDLAELIDTLSNRAGASNVYRVAPIASHVPERAARVVDPMTPIAEAWPANLPRPIRLFTPPEPVEVMALMPDHPPARFSWRGQTRKIRCADGPERIFAEWWQKPDEILQSRDYFRVEDEDGGRYWLFRDGRLTPDNAYAWFLHGLFA